MVVASIVGPRVSGSNPCTATKNYSFFLGRCKMLKNAQSGKTSKQSLMVTPVGSLKRDYFSSWGSRLH